MGIKRAVHTRVICDICGEEILGWYSISGSGVSRLLASIYARESGATVGKRVVCKECRIKRRINACKDSMKGGDGTCLGLAKSIYDDEPVEKCKRCIAHSGYDWEEQAGNVAERRRKLK